MKTRKLIKIMLIATLTTMFFISCEEVTVSDDTSLNEVTDTITTDTTIATVDLIMDISFDKSFVTQYESDVNSVFVPSSVEAIAIECITSDSENIENYAYRIGDGSFEDEYGNNITDMKIPLKGVPLDSFDVVLNTTSYSEDNYYWDGTELINPCNNPNESFNIGFHSWNQLPIGFYNLNSNSTYSSDDIIEYMRTTIPYMSFEYEQENVAITDTTTEIKVTLIPKQGRVIATVENKSTLYESVNCRFMLRSSEEDILYDTYTTIQNYDITNPSELELAWFYWSNTDCHTRNDEASFDIQLHIYDYNEVTEILNIQHMICASNDNDYPMYGEPRAYTTLVHWLEPLPGWDTKVKITVYNDKVEFFAKRHGSEITKTYTTSINVNDFLIN